MVVLVDLSGHAVQRVQQSNGPVGHYGVFPSWESSCSKPVVTERPREPETNDFKCAKQPVEFDVVPNINAFTAALGRYPIISDIVAGFDLMSLQNLAVTCKQARAELLPFRHQLVTHTLPCANEELDDLSADYNAAVSLDGTPDSTVDESLRRKRGKVARCARDLVQDCRRCGQVTCRNCIVKPPAPAALAGRHRRLCNTCLAAPIEQHTAPIISGRQSRCIDPADQKSFTSSAFLHDPCTCSESVWLCQTCGLSLHCGDTTYQRVWTWRTRYSAYLSSYLGGGVGNGLVKGNEGVQCGKGGDCLAGKEYEVEIDCDAVDLAAAAAAAAAAAPGVLQRQVTPPSGSFTPYTRRSTPSEDDDEHELGPSYERQEIEGIGGVVKKKIKRMERVGRVVREWDDERSGKATFLGREKTGQERSWCGWCGRVIMGPKDTQDV